MNSSDAKGPHLDVIVVGAGFGGLYAVYKFREMGLKIAAFEAGGDVGGVWYWNRYPGARVDLPSIDYSYSFSPEVEQEWTWSEEFASQPELLAYFNFVADRLDLRRHYQFKTRIVRAVWDEARKLWTVTTDRGETVAATYCVMATGPLSVPRDPEIPGVELYTGELLRAGRWPHHRPRDRFQRADLSDEAADCADRDAYDFVARVRRDRGRRVAAHERTARLRWLNAFACSGQYAAAARA